MTAPLAIVLVVLLGVQEPAADPARAVELARAGRTAEALALFEHVVVQHPDDVDARLWVARLQMRLGRVLEAEKGFRAVLTSHPADIDARIGLAGLLLRRNAWHEALDLLRDVEPRAGQNADFFAVLARAYHRAGDDRSALDYYAKAHALAPDDQDVRYAYEDTAEIYATSLTFEGFGEHVGPSSNAGSGTLRLGLRVQPRVRVDGEARVQQRAGGTDVTAGGAVEWKASLADVLYLRAVGGPGNTSLAVADLSADLIHYAGEFEIGASVRRLWFNGVDVVAASPLFVWDHGRWRTDARYTYSHSSFQQTGKTSGDSSAFVRETWRPLWRLNVNATYAYGIESFEVLTADRLGALGASTVAGGVRVRTPQLTQMFLTWEHQWRSNSTTLDRVTITISRAFP